MKKGFWTKFVAVMFVVVLFGGSTFAMQQWLPFMGGESESPVVDEPVVAVQAASTELPQQLQAVQNANEPENTPEAVEPTGEPEEAEPAVPVSATPNQQQSNTTQNSNRSNNSTASQNTGNNTTRNSTGGTGTSTPAPQEAPAAPAPSVPETQQSVPSAPETQQPAPSAPETQQPTPVVEAPAQNTPSNPYRTLSSRDHRLLTRVVVKNNTEELSGNVRVEVPLISSGSVYQSRRSETFNIEPSEIKTVSGIRTGVFHLGDLEPGEETVVEIRTEMRFSLIEHLANYVPQNSDKSSSYLGASSGIESTNSQIVSLSNQITSGQSSDWDKARAITRWVATNIRYDASASNRNSGALAALQSRSGVCEDYAMLSAALARAAGIPARIVYGYADSGSTNWPSSGSFSLSGYRHAWVEFSLEGRGWVPAEPTRSTSSNLLFGRVQHNRYFIQGYRNANLSFNFSGGRPNISWSQSLY